MFVAGWSVLFIAGAEQERSPGRTPSQDGRRKQDAWWGNWLGLATPVRPHHLAENVDERSSGVPIYQGASGVVWSSLLLVGGAWGWRPNYITRVICRGDSGPEPTANMLVRYKTLFVRSKTLANGGFLLSLWIILAAPTLLFCLRVAVRSEDLDRGWT